MQIGPVKHAFDIVLLVGLIAIVTWTFQIKHDSQRALERVAELEKQIAAEKVEIDLLKSDWSLLTNPARLQELTERYADELGLSPMDPTQIAAPSELNALPVEPIPEPKVDGTTAGVDADIRTGGIGAILKRADDKTGEAADQ